MAYKSKRHSSDYFAVEKEEEVQEQEQKEEQEDEQ